jgi:hypothetical protein
MPNFSCFVPKLDRHRGRSFPHACSSVFKKRTVSVSLDRSRHGRPGMSNPDFCIQCGRKRSRQHRQTRTDSCAGICSRFDVRQAQRSNMKRRRGQKTPNIFSELWGAWWRPRGAVLESIESSQENPKGSGFAKSRGLGSSNEQLYGLKGYGQKTSLTTLICGQCGCNVGVLAVRKGYQSSHRDATLEIASDDVLVPNSYVVELAGEGAIAELPSSRCCVIPSAS